MQAITRTVKHTTWTVASAMSVASALLCDAAASDRASASCCCCSMRSAHTTKVGCVQGTFNAPCELLLLDALCVHGKLG
eukprot:scaffold82958_cov23-Tisochrysis_lutea.AAC.1